jgi:DNA-binding NtrC family response regulator
LRCHAQPGVELPEPETGTLIVSEVTRLDAEQQARMLEWMNRVRRDVQVVCTSSQPIFRRVLSGTFVSELYYRINALRLDLSDPVEQVP